MFPSYSTSDVRFEMIERELYVYKIKANKCGIWPLARGIDSPHTDLREVQDDLKKTRRGITYTATEIQNTPWWIIWRVYHGRSAVEKASPQVMIYGITGRKGSDSCPENGLSEGSVTLPVKDVSVIRDWVWCLSRWVLVVFAAMFFDELAIFTTRIGEVKGRTDAHGGERQG
jgi:hypothetical protein